MKKIAASIAVFVFTLLIVMPALAGGPFTVVLMAYKVPEGYPSVQVVGSTLRKLALAEIPARLRK